MYSHCVPFPEAGGPVISIWSGGLCGSSVASTGALMTSGEGWDFRSASRHNGEIQRDFEECTKQDGRIERDEARKVF